MRVSKAKVKIAQKAPDAYRMARKLLPEFFTPEELVTCSCVPSKRPIADMEKMDLLLSMYTFIDISNMYIKMFYSLHCIYPLYDTYISLQVK